MDTSSVSHSIVPIAALAERLAACERTHVLVLKTDDFARTAWLHGRDEAAALERRAAASFVELGKSALRHDDVLAHSFGSDVFAVALSGERDRATEESRLRRALARIERRFVDGMPIAVLASWATVAPGDDVLAMLETAAERARRRRDRREFAELIHDLATPVSAISGSLSALLDGSLDVELEQRFLRAAYDESSRIGRMLREFLAVERSLLEVPRESAELGDVMTRAFDAVRPLAHERDITLRLCRGSEPLLTPMNADVAVSLVVNLAANAIKHGHPGGRVQGRIRAAGANCELEVDDDGPGVREADRERIFEFGGRGTSSAPGFGIGLSQVRRIVRDHGGDICVEGSPLGGARFIVRLPREAVAL